MSARRNWVDRLIWSTAILHGFLVGPVLGEDLAPAEDRRERRAELVVDVLEEVVAVALGVAQPLVAALELLVEPRVPEEERGLVGVSVDRGLVLGVEAAGLVGDREDAEDPDLGLERREDDVLLDAEGAARSTFESLGSDATSFCEARLAGPVAEDREALVGQAERAGRAAPRRGRRSPAASGRANGSRAPRGRSRPSWRRRARRSAA